MALSFFGSKAVTLQQNTSLTKLFHVNNAPVNSFCNTVPTHQPSLVSTTFGQSLLVLIILLTYLVLYRSQTTRTGVESRLLVSLILGNVLFALLAFDDWFNLSNHIVLCNDYKQGVLNLYQLGELVETYKLTNLLGLYWVFTRGSIAKYGTLAYKQFAGLITKYGTLAYTQFVSLFVRVFIDGWKDAYHQILNYLQKEKR